MRKLIVPLLAAAAIMTPTLPAPAAPPPGFTIPEITLSPDRRFGILVPDEERYEAGARNKLVEANSGRVLAVINGAPGVEQMNHGGVDATRRSPDSSLLLWRVDGKWFPRALVLIKLNPDDGKVRWQLDLLKTGQQEILVRVRKAAPKRYGAAKKRNVGNGSAYPDGFTIDVKTEALERASLALPLKILITLTSNPKAIEDFPKNAQLDATLEGEVRADGKFRVLTFDLEPERPNA